VKTSGAGLKLQATIIEQTNHPEKYEQIELEEAYPDWIPLDREDDYWSSGNGLCSAQAANGYECNFPLNDLGECTLLIGHEDID
jgi:hypothetical protein